MEILSPEFVNRFRSRIINIHPSLLPEFRGLNAIERAFEHRVKQSGVTIHFVDEGVDTGPVIEQRKVKLRWWLSCRQFEKRIHAAEHKLLPSVIEKAASGKLKLGDERELTADAPPVFSAERSTTRLKLRSSRVA
jgi:phosphoribosylglycinamide formyltransferase-1